MKKILLSIQSSSNFAGKIATMDTILTLIVLCIVVVMSIRWRKYVLTKNPVEKSEVGFVAWGVCCVLITQTILVVGHFYEYFREALNVALFWREISHYLLYHPTFPVSLLLATPFLIWCRKIKKTSSQ